MECGFWTWFARPFAELLAVLVMLAAIAIVGGLAYGLVRIFGRK